MRHKPTWIIFDIGRVLFNFDKFALDLAEKFNIQEEALFAQINLHSKSSFEGQKTVEQFWRSVLAAFNLEQYMEEIMFLWNTEEKYWVADTKSLIKELRNNGYQLAILTNNWGNQTSFLRKSFSELIPVEYMFESAVEKLSKPDKKFFQLVQNRIGNKGSEILFIDDTKRYLEGAEKLGWQTFQYAIGNDLGITTNNLLRKMLLD